MTTHYHHTQIGYFMIIALAITLLYCVSLMTMVIGFNWIMVTALRIWEFA